MAPKRRGAQARAAAAPKPAPPDPPKLAPPSKPAPTPAPIPPPPPMQPPETSATKVRKEWSKFMDVWYEPQKKKLVEKLQKDLLVKYKNLGSPKETQKLREMELFEKLDSLAQQLSQPARTEWERRLELAQLREDQWDDMSGEEQQAVMSVFVGFFADDIEDMNDDDVSAEPSSVEEDENVVEEPQYRGVPSYPPSASSRQPIPPTPIKGNFEFVNPTSFFADTMTPPNPSKNLPALSMDHLATLGPSNPGRSAEPVSASVSGTLSYQNWASEVGIVTQQPPVPPAKAPSTTTSAQTLSARPRATDIMSRQASAASNLSSPPSKTISPQYSPPNPTTKFSPSANADNLPLGKRYIGPIIVEEEPDPLDEGLLKSKMAEEYQQYKISLRIQMIYQFHAEAAEFEIKLFETLLASEGTKESRARAVQEHETSMMRLREQKEEERKRLCAEERERRREEIRQHLAQRRSPAQNREVDPGPKANPSKPGPDKTLGQDRPSKPIHQKENVPLLQPPVASSAMLESPSIIKKSNSTLSQVEASANEALFANAMAMMAQGKADIPTLTPAQAALNEAVFSNAAALLATQGPPGTGGKSTLQPPSITKKSNSSRSQEYDIPQITFSLAETSIPAPEPASLPPAAVKGRKGKKGQPVVQIPPTQPVTIAEEPETEAEPPPAVPSLWGMATDVAKNAWGAASASITAPKAKFSATVEDEADDFTSMVAPAQTKANVGTKKAPPASKKGKKVIITEEPDVDADPIISPPPSSKTKATKGAWGSVNGKSKVSSLFAEENNPEPPLPSMAPAWGKKTTKSAVKPQLKVTISDEQENELEWSPAPATLRTNRAKSACGDPSATPHTGTNTQAAKKAVQQQAEPRHGATVSGSRSIRVDNVPDPEDRWPGMAPGDSTMPGTVKFSGPDEVADAEDEEVNVGDWFKPENINYWANFMGSQAEAEPEMEAVPQVTEQEGKHVRWTPTVGGSDDEGSGEEDEELATSMWMQYAISGGDIPSMGDAPGGSQFMPSESTQGDTSLWEQGKSKKKSNPTAGDLGNRAQQTSVFDRAALTGQWPKMESWLSPPSRGQNSGSTRVF